MQAATVALRCARRPATRRRWIASILGGSFGPLEQRRRRLDLGGIRHFHGEFEDEVPDDRVPQNENRIPHSTIIAAPHTADHVGTKGLPSPFDNEVQATLAETPSTLPNFGTAFELIFLGTSSGAPTETRNTTSIALKMPGESWLFDAGDGVTGRVMAAQVSNIQKIFISHLHSDHVLGLCSLLVSLTSEEGAKRIDIYGPLGLSRVIREPLMISRRDTLTMLRIYEIVPKVPADANPMEFLPAEALIFNTLPPNKRAKLLVLRGSPPHQRYGRVRYVFADPDLDFSQYVVEASAGGYRVKPVTSSSSLSSSSSSSGNPPHFQGHSSNQKYGTTDGQETVEKGYPALEFHEDGYSRLDLSVTAPKYEHGLLSRGALSRAVTKYSAPLIGSGKDSRERISSMAPKKAKDSASRTIPLSSVSNGNASSQTQLQETNISMTSKTNTESQHSAIIKSTMGLETRQGVLPPSKTRLSTGDEDGCLFAIEDGVITLHFVSGMSVKAIPLPHSDYCLGWVIQEPDRTNILRDMMKSAKLPEGKYLSLLKQCHFVAVPTSEAPQQSQSTKKSGRRNSRPSSNPTNSNHHHSHDNNDNITSTSPLLTQLDVSDKSEPSEMSLYASSPHERRTEVTKFQAINESPCDQSINTTTSQSDPTTPTVPPTSILPPHPPSISQSDRVLTKQSVQTWFDLGPCDMFKSKAQLPPPPPPKDTSRALYIFDENYKPKLRKQSSSRSSVLLDHDDQGISLNSHINGDANDTLQDGETVFHGGTDSSIHSPQISASTSALVSPRSLAPPPPKFSLDDLIVLDPRDFVTVNKGRKIVLLFDTHGVLRLRPEYLDAMCDADILVHESTICRRGRQADLHATVRAHSTPSMAAKVAQYLRARTLILHHFSRRYRDDVLLSIDTKSLWFVNNTTKQISRIPHKQGAPVYHLLNKRGESVSDHLLEAARICGLCHDERAIGEDFPFHHYTYGMRENLDISSTFNYENAWRVSASSRAWHKDIGEGFLRPPKNHRISSTEQGRMWSRKGEIIIDNNDGSSTLRGIEASALWNKMPISLTGQDDDHGDLWQHQTNSHHRPTYASMGRPKLSKQQLGESIGPNEGDCGGLGMGVGIGRHDHSIENGGDESKGVLNFVSAQERDINTRDPSFWDTLDDEPSNFPSNAPGYSSPKPGHRFTNIRDELALWDNSRARGVASTNKSSSTHEDKQLVADLLGIECDESEVDVLVSRCYTRLGPKPIMEPVDVVKDLDILGDLVNQANTTFTTHLPEDDAQALWERDELGFGINSHESTNYGLDTITWGASMMRRSSNSSNNGNGGNTSSRNHSHTLGGPKLSNTNTFTFETGLTKTLPSLPTPSSTVGQTQSLDRFSGPTVGINDSLDDKSIPRFGSTLGQSNKGRLGPLFMIKGMIGKAKSSKLRVGDIALGETVSSTSLQSSSSTSGTPPQTWRQSNLPISMTSSMPFSSVPFIEQDDVSSDNSVFTEATGKPEEQPTIHSVTLIPEDTNDKQLEDGMDMIEEKKYLQSTWPRQIITAFDLLHVAMQPNRARSNDTDTANADRIGLGRDALTVPGHQRSSLSVDDIDVTHKSSTTSNLYP